MSARSLGAALTLPPAALWTMALFGRLDARNPSVRWLLGCAALWVLCWLWSRTAPRATGGLVPAALLGAGAVGVLYVSPEAYHAWVFTPRPKGLLVALSVCLALLAPAVGSALAGHAPGARAWITERWRWLLGALLGGFAAAHALSYSQVATDDLIRYWAIADAWAQGHVYAVAEGDPAARQFYLVDVPVYPALVALSFALLGHTYAALHAPLVAANLVLPFLLYGAARAAGATTPGAVGVALTLVALPMAQVYAFGSAEPDPLWAALLAALAWLGTRLGRVDGGARLWWEWLALGAVAALVLLTRPEGPLYAGPLALGLAWQHLRPRRGASAPTKPLLAGFVGGVPVVVFSGFLLWAFGIVWPAGFGNVASPVHVPRNVELVLRQNLPHYAASMGLPTPELSGPLCAALLGAAVLAGAARLWRRAPGLRLLLLSPALNLAVILVSPTDLAADHFSPPTFFRHWAITLPWLTPALGAALPRSRPWAPGASVALGALFVWESVILLALPLAPQRNRPPILTSDPYVLVTDLVRAKAPLPPLPLVDGPGRAVTIDERFAYLPFRQRLFDAMRPYNLHALDAGRAHVLASMVFGLVALAAAGATSAQPRPRPARARAQPLPGRR